jgi:hypothetical protein
MHSLQHKHEMNAYRADDVCMCVCGGGGGWVAVCLSDHLIQLKKYWMDLKEIWYGHYATGG